jgi:hypothetical protein
VTPPWEGRSKHFTQEFEAFALTVMREMPVKRAGQILGESDTRLWRMLFDRLKAAHARLSFDNVVWVGADEMNQRKGHNYLMVFADLLAKRVLFATPGKDASWEAFAAAQRAFQSDSACGYRHERGLHQGGGQQPGERSGGVRQIPRHPECVGGVRPGPEGGESV